MANISELYNIRVCIGETIMFIYDNGKQKYVGELADYVYLFLSKMNLRYQIVHHELLEFGHFDGNGSGSGLLGSLARNECDISMMELPATYISQQYLEYTLPITINHWKIISKQSKYKPIDVFGIMHIFQNELWWIFLFCIFSLPVFWMLWTSLIKSKKLPSVIRLLEGEIASLAVVLRNSFEIKTKLSSDRIYWITWILMSFIISSIFTGNLLSMLALKYDPRSDRGIMNVLTRVRASRLKHYLQKSSTNSMINIQERIRTKNSKRNWLEMDAIADLETLKKGEALLLLTEQQFYDFTLLLKVCGGSEDEKISENNVYIDYSAYQMQKGLNLLVAERFRRLSSFVFETGTLAFLYDQQLNTGRKCFDQVEQKEPDMKLYLESFYLPFVIWTTGLCVS